MEVPDAAPLAIAAEMEGLFFVTKLPHIAGLNQRWIDRSRERARREDKYVLMNASTKSGP